MKTIIVFRTGLQGTWREKFNGISAYAKSADWRLQPVDARSKRSDFRHLVDFWRPDGVIIDAAGSLRMFSKASFGNLPVVVMNPQSEVDARWRYTVSHDSLAITKLAVSELLQIAPASIVFVEWIDPAIQWSAVKKAAAAKIAEMHGIPFSVVTPGRGDAENAAQLEKRIADALVGAPRPCGIFAVTDLVGAAAVSAANRIGASVPDEVSVSSVDDNPELCESCSPSLTSVRPDFHRFGFAAGRLLDEAMSGEAGARKGIVVPPLGIVRRASTMQTRILDKTVNKALERIRLHACDGISPKDVARHFGQSQRMAEMRFKAATGKTMGEAIIERRLSAACDYLKDGKVSVSAIANLCGWKSDRAFRMVFESRFGVSPRTWQKDHA